MNIRIGELNSTIRATDSQALLTPQLLDQISLAVIERLQSEQDRQEMAEVDRRLRSGVFDDERDASWA